MDLGLNLLAGLELNFRALPEQLLNGILTGSIYALIALGYTMVYGVLRLINFAHGEVFMLGAYVALFVSYFLGFGPGESGQSSVVNLLLMILAAMALCALVGVVIERFAYRPMRSHSRIASLITAIGVSLFLQYGGALFLPNSPPPSINEQVNPYRGAAQITLVAPPPELQRQMVALEPAYREARQDYDEYLARTGEDPFNLSPEGRQMRQEMQEVQREYEAAEREYAAGGVQVTIRTGQAIILGVTVVLMAILTYLVMFTKPGRAMRAVSHDFDSAALMGINVNTIVTFTFILGSSLAGAAAMMQATFLGTPLHTFVGLMPGVKAFVAAVLGGIGNIPGAVLGGLLMGVAESITVWAGYSQYRDAIAFVVLIVVLLFRPGGILGSAKVEKV
jgi:branched-chain amino acid transport system permease protein